MRFVDRKQFPPPEFLFSKAFEPAHDAVRHWLDLPEDERAQSRVSVDWEILNVPEIRDALSLLFRNRCGFCESDWSERVRHFRPIEAAEDPDGLTSHAHYGWLIYEWENLLPICDVCDRSKRNRFWVIGERAPIGAPMDVLRSKERPLLLDPTDGGKAAIGELTFSPNGRAKPLGQRGTATIELVNLNRKDLVKVRYEAFRYYLQHFQSKHVRSQFWTEADLTRPISSPDWLVSEDIPFAGATSMVLRTVANAVGEWAGVTFETLDKLIDFLDDMEPDKRPELVSEIFAEIDDLPEDLDISLGVQKPKRERGPTRWQHARDMEYTYLRIASIEIQNFKAIKHLRFELPEAIGTASLAPAMMLLGENATGKSTAMEAVALALIGTREIAHMGLAPREFLRLTDPVDPRSVEGPLTVTLHFHGDAPPVSLTAPADPDVPGFEGTEEASKVVLAYGPRRFFPKEKRRRFRGPEYRVESLFDPMSVILNPRYWLLSRDRPEFDALARALREILPSGSVDKLETDGEEVWVRSGERRDPIDKLSAGYATVLAMATDIIREMLQHFDNLEHAHGVVVIDEIETHLHPRWKMRVVNSLRRALPNVQFLITTHDPLCLRGMQNGEVFVLERDLDDSIKLVADLPSIKGMRAEQILTSEFFGLGSTDPETEAKLALYHSLIVRQKELSLDEEEKLEGLRDELGQNMVVGDTLIEQAVADALRKATDEGRVEPDRSARPERKHIVSSVLDRLLQIKEADE